MRGAAYYAQPIFDFLNIPEGISEDQGAQLVFCYMPFLHQAFPLGGFSRRVAAKGNYGGLVSPNGDG